MKASYKNAMLFAIITLLVIAFSQGCTQPPVPFTYHNVQEWDNLTYKAFSKCPSLPNLTSPLAGIQHYEYRKRVLEVISKENLTFKKGHDIYLLEINGLGSNYRIMMWQSNEKPIYEITLLGEEYSFEKTVEHEFHERVFSFFNEDENPCINSFDGFEIIQGMRCLTTFEYNEQDSSYHIKDLKVEVD
ncbi:hypothetical protein AAG747_06525 [Rapidithrix thailandica]|uniref:Lipoprotein n=1 Tax=Rapidithrix thailandica TaxID=413964 RepID=A0AAW9S1S1_9BACT